MTREFFRIRPLTRRRDENACIAEMDPQTPRHHAHLVMTPLEFLQRLAALIPRPRLHLIRFHGVLAPNATLRSQIVPGEADQAMNTIEGDGELSAPSPRA